MLSFIRDKLKSWVVGILVILVAIPLIFLGVGDYGTNNEQYAFKVNDQEVSRSIVMQEMGQFKDVLRKNYQGSIPPIYTDQFIKKITFDNLIRRNIENNISTSIGLVMSDKSIIDQIKNTSSFRDEDGFNPKLYKRRLYMINMNPELYEQYIYQKGIRDQLRTSITDSSFLTMIDKKLNINANYHKKTGKLYLLENNHSKNNIQLSLDDINNYYEKNKDDFMSNEEAEFIYLRLNKKSIINSIDIEEIEIKENYENNLGSGMYTGDVLYEINHLVFPNCKNKNEVLTYAKEAYEELLQSGKSFEYISINYDVSDDTKNNSGYLGKLTLNELPDVIKSNIKDINHGDIKLITTESNAIHIFRIVDIKSSKNKSYDEVKEDIEADLRTKKGAQKYFSILDSIKEKIYGGNVSLSKIAKTYDLKLFKTTRIDKSYQDNILSSSIVNNLFINKPNNDLYSPIYISNDDVLFIKRSKYYEQRQLSINESEEAIKALLSTQINLKAFNESANKKLLSLNSGLDTDYELFSVYKYDKTYNDQIMDLINNQRISSSFISNKLGPNKFLFLKIDSIDPTSINENRVDSDNYLDFLRNTQSESDYNSFYLSKYDSFEIDINEDYLNQ